MSVFGKYFIFICIITGVFQTVFSIEKKGSLVLISKDYNGHIQKWMQDLAPELEMKIFINISRDSMEYYLQRAEGIIIGGGEDIYPALYGKPEYAEYCGPFDKFRDSMEITMIHYAAENKIPLLGICRGHQLLNVVNGGTLIPDIPTFYPESNIIHRNNKDQAHRIEILPLTWLAPFCVKGSCYVNSRHHQCIDVLAPGFQVSARSFDGIIESIEYMDSNHPFIKGVQWHPESLRDSLSIALGRAFIKSIYH